MIHDIIIILNLVILESLLSIDNAAVLAVMAKDLPVPQQKKALRYGLLGAYVFRGICLLLAVYLMKVIWLKAAGGFYLLWLAYGHFTKANDTIEEISDPKDSKIIKFAEKIGINHLWATIILIEIMDLAFSIDNVFAAVALSDKFWVIMTGVAIGILAMRFVAGKFLSLMNKYPSLENSAFIVIGCLGIKLILSSSCQYFVELLSVGEFMDQHWFDLAFSGLMMLIFFFPILFKSRS